MGAPERCREHGRVRAWLWKGLGWHLKGHFCLYGINGLGNELSHLAGPPFPTFRAGFSAILARHLTQALVESLLSGGYGYNEVCALDG